MVTMEAADKPGIPELLETRCSGWGVSESSPLWVPVTRRHLRAGTAPSPRGDHRQGLWGMGRETQNLTALGLSKMLVSCPPEGVEQPGARPACALSPWRPPSSHSGSRLCAVRVRLPGGRRTFPSLLSRLSPQPGRFQVPGSSAPRRPSLVRHREGALQVRGFAAAAVSVSGSLLPRLPLPAFGWTSPVCAPCGEGLQVLPALAFES